MTSTGSSYFFSKVLVIYGPWSQSSWQLPTLACRVSWRKVSFASFTPSDRSHLTARHRHDSSFRHDSVRKCMSNLGRSCNVEMRDLIWILKEFQNILARVTIMTCNMFTMYFNIYLPRKLNFNSMFFLYQYSLKSAVKIDETCCSSLVYMWISEICWQYNLFIQSIWRYPSRCVNNTAMWEIVPNPGKFKM